MDEPVPQQPKRRVKVEPEPEGTLEQLLVAGKRFKDEAALATEQADDLKNQIKAWLLGLFPGGDYPDAFDIPADPHGRYPAYSMTLQEGWRLDTEAMKDQAPDVYVKFAKRSKPTWTFRESKQGRRR